LHKTINKKALEKTIKSENIILSWEIFNLWFPKRSFNKITSFFQEEKVEDGILNSGHVFIENRTKILV